jgi:hypothetical protein
MAQYILVTRPSNVTLAAPVDGPLAANTLLTVYIPKVIAALTVDTRAPEVALVPANDNTPTADLPRRALDDVHTVASHRVAPTAIALLKATDPTFDPSTVTLAAPVIGTLETTSSLQCKESAVKTTDSDPIPGTPAVVKSTPKLWYETLVCFPVIALDEVHAVAAPLLPPTRTVSLWAVAPALDPSRVTLAAPVDAPLLCRRLLMTGPAKL